MTALHFLLLITLIHAQGSNTKIAHNCKTNIKSSCVLENVELTSSRDINELELPKEQRVIHFIKGNIPKFSEQLYQQLQFSTNLTINKCKVKELFVGIHLVHLNASRNQISTLQRSSEANYANLRVLDLSNNQLTQVSSVLGFINLEFLDLSSNAIESVDLADFNVLIKLKLLDLGNNRISVWDSSQGLRLDSLNELRLRNTQLLEFNTHDWLLPTLTRLDLSSNQLYYLNAEDLSAAFPVLSQVDLTGNQWACHGLSKLLTLLRKYLVEFNHSSESCSPPLISIQGVCCEDRYVDYVTMQAQWDVHRLQRGLRSMNHSLGVKLDSVRTDQGVQIRVLKKQLAEQDDAMQEMKRSLVQMDQLIDDLLEDLYQKQLEADVIKLTKSRSARPPAVVPVF